MNDLASPAPVPRRRRKLCVALVLALPLVCWQWEIGRQQLALFRAREFGLELRYSGFVVDRLGFDGPSKFADADWDLIRPIAGVEDLDLTFTQVTSRSLERLDDFPRLTTVDVLVTQITPEQEEWLLRTRPRLYIRKYHMVDGTRVVDGFQ